MPTKIPKRFLSTLPKMWNQFEVLPDGTAILTGNYNLHHKRFKGTTTQGAAVALICCAMQKLIKMELWTSRQLDTILDLGTKLHWKSLQFCTNKNLKQLEPPHVYRYFFLDTNKLTMFVGTNNIRQKLFKESKPLETLIDILRKFLFENQSGIFSAQKKFYTIWYNPELKLYFLFDALEHQRDGKPWNGVPDWGFCYCLQSKSLTVLAKRIFDNLEITEITKFYLFPCYIEKIVEVNVKPPDKLPTNIPQVVTDVKLPTVGTTAVVSKPTKKTKPIVTELVTESEPKKEEGEILKAPPERLKIKSVTNFMAMGDGSCGILRGTKFQPSLEYSQSNSLAALTMLRLYKSKKWLPQILDDILELGKLIQATKLPTNCKFIEKIPINGKLFKPNINTFGSIGQLQSTIPEVLDLQPALTNILLENDCCIIVGPLILPIWIEDNYYYMFDPNQRDINGLKIVEEDGGVACITWFSNLKDLVTLYMNNLDKNQKRSKFILWKVKIEDFIEIPEKWYNFEPIQKGKWILRGTFNQNHKRFGETRNVQCTANATMALAYAQLKENEQFWDRTIVDKVLLSGNELYKLSINDLKETNKYKEAMLMVDEIKRQFFVENKMIDFEIEDCLVNGIVNAHENSGILDLNKGFNEFFNKCDSGIVTANLQSMAVWKRNDAFYYYDSHSRNEKGIVCRYGTACLLRLLTIDDLVKALTVNLGANKTNLYNISRIQVKLTDTNEDGIIKPPLNNFTPLNDYVAIIRSQLSTQSEQFGLNKGKQAIPMAFTALAFNNLQPCSEWTQSNLDEILILGDKLCYETLEIVSNEDYELPPPIVNEDGEEQQQEEIIPEDIITTQNVKKEYQIGANKFEFELGDIIEGNYDENLKEQLENLYGMETFQCCFESKYLQVMLWRDDHLLYLFDANPRTNQGQIYGKEEWPILDDGEEEEAEEEENEDEDEEKETGGGGDNLNTARINDDDEENIEEEEQQQEENINKGPPSWKIDEEKNGRGCLLRFSRLDDLIAHIIDNSPEPERPELQFTITNIILKNTPQIRNIFNPEIDEKEDDDLISGPWYNFFEMDHGQWILRSLKTLADPSFPIINHNKQYLPACLNCFIFVKAYSLEKFQSITLDTILMYADRCQTFQLRQYESNLKKAGVTNDEIQQFIKTIEFTIEDYPKKFCILEKLCNFDVTLSAVCGDITSNEPDEILNLPKAIEKLFELFEFGILSMRNYYCGIWKYKEFYFMFDPHQIGPGGICSPIGMPAITRYQNVECLCTIFIGNLPEIGENFFEIHGITLNFSKCQRERVPEERLPPKSKLAGFQLIIPGKEILRADLKQDYTKYDGGVHAQGAAVAFIALAMSLIQKVETWTKLIVNQILTLGDVLHNLTIEKLGERFNPWIHKLKIFDILTDFRIGSMKINACIRDTTQQGYVEVKKYPTEIINLRQGIERFFQENTHGILVVENNIHLAIWEEELDENEWIYLYDPNSRGLTGLPTTGGVACTMKFANAKMITEHILALLMGYDREGMVFVIYPVEILVGGKRKTRRKEKLAVGKCDMGATQAQKQFMRHLAEKERERKKEKKLAQMGRLQYVEISKNEWICRGTGSIIDENRGVATNVIAYVAMKIYPIDKATFKHIDTILTIGNDVYMESIQLGRIKNGRIGLENVQRTFFFKQYRVHIKIYKPQQFGMFTQDRLSQALRRYFQKENYCLLNYRNHWLSLLELNGYYYCFDPYGCCMKGKRMRNGGGNACFIKFDGLEFMTQRIYNNLITDYYGSNYDNTNRYDNEEENCFALTVIKMMACDTSSGRDGGAY